MPPESKGYRLYRVRDAPIQIAGSYVQEEALAGADYTIIEYLSIGDPILNELAHEFLVDGFSLYAL